MTSIRKTVVATAILVGVTVGSSGTAWAGGFGFHVGFRRGHGSFHVGYNNRGHHRRYDQRRHRARVHHRGRHHCRPVYRDVWVPAYYRTIKVGYDDCGNPIYDRVLVRDGYYRSVRSLCH